MSTTAATNNAGELSWVAQEIEHQDLHNSHRSSRTTNNLVPLPPSIDEGPSPFVQEGVARKNLQAACVTYLDGHKYTFYTHKNADGEILFDMVANQLNLLEKDYFGLAFYDDQSVRHWLYKDKRISKQLKGLPWTFSFEVKFYSPQPSQLAEDLTRYLLCLQLRQDIYNERLPVSFVAQAKLGSLAAQSEFGDYDGSEDYENYLKNAKISQVMSAELLDRIMDLHKHNRGLTPPDAELAYLNDCKELAMYGVHLFTAKDSKGKPVQIGVSSHGLSVYNDQMRLHRFAWVNIIKFSYRRNTFTIKLKPGELDKKETVATYKLQDYPSAKRLWKCAVEHHTFFRLIQPEGKSKSSFLSFGSTRFRYQGRTNIQSHMASQLFDSSGPSVERVSSGRAVSKSADDIAVKNAKLQTTSPLHYADDGSRDLINSPEKSYHVTSKSLITSTTKKQMKENLEEAKKKEKKAKKEKKKKEDEKKKKLKKSKKLEVDVSSDSSSSSSHSDVEVEVLADAKGFKTAKQSKGITTQMLEAEQQRSAGPYIPANDSSGRVIREEKVEQVYRIAGNGRKIPQVDPKDASLLGTLSKLTPKSNVNVKMVDESVLVRENAPVPHSIKESSPPHTTVHTWHESTAQPETVTTEVDEDGNIIRRTVIKSEQVKHTVQTQSYQTYAIDENAAPIEVVKQESVVVGGQSRVGAGQSNKSPTPVPPPRASPAVERHSRTIAYENGIHKEQQESSSNGVEELGAADLVSTKAVTTGNRTVETLTYKKEKDGVIETHVEHRITIHSGDEIDHDAELSRAILEATNMNPEMTVEKIVSESSTH